MFALIKHAFSRCKTQSVTTLLLTTLSVAVMFALALLSGCAAQARIDDASPQLIDTHIEAGSQLTEESQYVKILLTFDAELEASGNVTDDVEVKLNGKEPDTRSIVVALEVSGPNVVVWITPTEEAWQGTASSVYYALYDGVITLQSRAENGGLAHVKAAGGSSNAVLEGTQTFTVPSGIVIENVEVTQLQQAYPEANNVTADNTNVETVGGEGANAQGAATENANAEKVDGAGPEDTPQASQSPQATQISQPSQPSQASQSPQAAQSPQVAQTPQTSQPSQSSQLSQASQPSQASQVTFDIVQFAQLRCCTWFTFGEGLPLVMMHNHEFTRDTPQLCAKRLVDTINEVYGDALFAEVKDTQVTVRAVKGAGGEVIRAALVEGPGADPTANVLGNIDLSQDGNPASSQSGVAA